MGVRLSDQYGNTIKIFGNKITYKGVVVVSEYLEVYLEFGLIEIEGLENHTCLSLSPRLIGGHRIGPIECKVVSMLNKKSGMRHLFLDELPFAFNVPDEKFIKEYRSLDEEAAKVYLVEYLTRNMIRHFDLRAEVIQSEGRFGLIIEFYCSDNLELLWSYKPQESKGELSKFFRPLL